MAETDLVQPRMSLTLERVAQLDLSDFDRPLERRPAAQAQPPPQAPPPPPAVSPPHDLSPFDAPLPSTTQAVVNPYEVADWEKLTSQEARERLQAIPAYDARKREAYDALPWYDKLTTAPPPGMHPNVREATVDHLQDIAVRDQNPAVGSMEPSWALDAPQLLINMAPQGALAVLGVASKAVGKTVKAGTEAVTSAPATRALTRWLAPYGEAASTITEALAETPLGQYVTGLGRWARGAVSDLHGRTVPTFLRPQAKAASLPIRHYSAEQRLHALRAHQQLQDGMVQAEAKLREMEQAWHDAWLARHGAEPGETPYVPRPPQGAMPPRAATPPPPVSPLWEGSFKYGYIPDPEIPLAEQASWFEYAMTQGYKPPTGGPNGYPALLRNRAALRALQHLMGDTPTPAQLGREQGLRLAISQQEKYLAEAAYQYMMHRRPLDPRLQDYIPAQHKPLPFEVQDTDPILNPPPARAKRGQWMPPKPPPSASTTSGEPLWLTRQDAEQALSLAGKQGFTASPPLQQTLLEHQEAMDRVWQELSQAGGPEAGVEQRFLQLLRDEDRLTREAGQEALTWLLDHDLQGTPEALVNQHPWGRRLRGDPLAAHQPAYKGTPYPSPTNALRHFYDSLEHGLDKYSPQVEQQLREALEARYAQLRHLPREVQEDYLWNHWSRTMADQGEAQRVLEEIRENTHIPTSYTDTLMTSNLEALQSGLYPRSANPVEHVLGQLRTLDAFLMRHKALGAQQQLGLVRYVSAAEAVPEGWQALPDAVAESLRYTPGQVSTTSAGEGVQTAGRWYAPAEVAQIWKNWTSQGMHAHDWYHGLRSVSNAMVQLRLSISGFHALAESLYAMTSDVALGLMQLSEGRVAQGAGSVARGLNPWSVKWTFQEGRQLMQEAMFPGAMPPEIAEMVANLTKGGMDFQRGAFHSSAPSAAGNMWRQMQGNPLLSMVEKVSEPLMGKFVPAVKLGAAMRLAEEELARLGPGATEQQVRAAMARVVDSIDNRFGLLAYDNLFWNRTLKDLAHVMIQSPGWNLGWIREGGGAAFDLGKALSGSDPVLSSRTAFTMALPFVVGLYGGMMHFLMTGKHPETLQDYYYPQTGTARGKYQERVKLPSYMHDMAHMVHGMAEKGDLLGWATGKLNPLLTTANELVRNMDYFGLPIRGEHGRRVLSIDERLESLPAEVQPALRGLYQTILTLADAYVPFSIGQEWRSFKQGNPWDMLGGVLGITSAPGWAKESEGQRQRRQFYENRRIDQQRQRLENR